MALAEARIPAAGLIPALSPAVRRLTGHLSFTGVDVGCRGGLCPDLRPIAPLVDAVGFEADPAEAQHLTSRADAAGWLSVRVVPEALGRPDEACTLRITAAPGRSSLLEPNHDVAQAFSRSEDYRVERRVAVRTQALDTVAATLGLERIRYLKVDVQGWEDAVFAGARRILDDQLLAVRTEVSFRPTYQDQVLFRDVDRILAGHGLVLVDLPELHAWRRSSRAKLPRLATGSRRYSRGELVHGDALYLRDPDAVGELPGPTPRLHLEAGLLGLAHGQLDYAARVWDHPGLRDELEALLGMPPRRVLHEISRNLARAQRRRLAAVGLRMLREALRP